MPLWVWGLWAGDLLTFYFGQSWGQTHNQHTL